MARRAIIQIYKPARKKGQAFMLKLKRLKAKEVKIMLNYIKDKEYESM